jgi:hypothetical protein
MVIVPLVEAVKAACSSDLQRGGLRQVRPTALLVNASLPKGPDELLQPRIEVAHAVHPYAVEALDGLGRRLGPDTWSIPNKQLKAALRVFLPEALGHESGAGSQSDKVVVTPRTRRSLVRVPLLAGTVTLRYDDAEDLITTSSSPVFDASNGALAAWSSLRDASVVARSQPGSPNLARIVDARRRESIVAAYEAVRALDMTSSSIACDELVAEIAEMSSAEPGSHSGLLHVQQRVLGVFRAAKRGVVCALPPGSGKTVVAAAALSQVSSAIVAIPAGLAGQWQKELKIFAPGTPVLTVNSEAEAASLTSVEGVVLVPHRLLSAVKPGSIEVLVIDEAAFLCRESQRTKACWRLRTHASKALLLTGTPARRRTSDLGALVAFVLGDPRAFHGVPLGNDWSVRVGPLVQGAEDSDALPAACRELVSCKPTSAEAALNAAALAALTSARAALAQAEAGGVPGKERNRLRYVAQAAFDRARLAATDPAGVGGELAQLAEMVTAPAKRQALVSLCSDGLTSVVCCDSVVVATSIAEVLQDAGISAAVLSGALNRSQQASLVGELGKSIQVLVVAAAGQQGWNLQAASRVIHYDVPLTAAVARQREGRVRRFGGSDSTAVCLLLEGAVDADAASAWASASPDFAGM